MSTSTVSRGRTQDRPGLAAQSPGGGHRTGRCLSLVARSHQQSTSTPSVFTFTIRTSGTEHKKKFCSKIQREEPETWGQTGGGTGMDGRGVEHPLRVLATQWNSAYDHAPLICMIYTESQSQEVNSASFKMMVESKSLPSSGSATALPLVCLFYMFYIHILCTCL